MNSCETAMPKTTVYPGDPCISGSPSYPEDHWELNVSKDCTVVKYVRKNGLTEASAVVELVQKTLIYIANRADKRPKLLNSEKN